MHPLIPVWIIGGPFVGLLILAFSFKGSSAMAGPGPRPARGSQDRSNDPSAPLLDPIHPDAPRRLI